MYLIRKHLIVCVSMCSAPKRSAHYRLLEDAVAFIPVINPTRRTTPPTHRSAKTSQIRGDDGVIAVLPPAASALFTIPRR